jgi:hypothetical protein
MTPTTIAAGLALLAVAVTLPAGGRWFGLAVVFAAAVALLCFIGAFDATGPRPVLIAAAVAGVGVPVRLVVEPDAGLNAVPALVSAMLLTAFVVLVVSRRRREVTTVLALTMAGALIVGLGAGSLILLRGLQYGFRWALAALLLPLAMEAAALLGRRLRPDEPSAAPAARVVAAAAAAGGLFAAANPPMTPVATGGLTALCGAAAYAGTMLERAVASETPAADPAGTGLRWFAGVLLATPAGYLLALALQS